MKKTVTGGDVWEMDRRGGRLVLWACAGVCLWMTRALAGDPVTFTKTYTVGVTLNDVENPSRVFEVVVNGSGIGQLTEVKVGLKLVGASSGGGFASEMVVMLTKDLTTTSMLLNQVGVGLGSEASAAIGYGYDGWDVTFADNAVRGDVHAYDVGSGVMTGEIAPDGRIEPGDLLRPWTLSAMNGLEGDGHWYLSVADVAEGGVMRLESWSLTMKGLAAVPEPGWCGGAVGMGLCVWGILRRKR